MGSCISNSNCMKDFSTTFEDPSILTVSPCLEIEEVENDKSQMMLQKMFSVKKDTQVEIRQITQNLRPMLKRSITVAYPEILEIPKNMQVSRKVTRTKSGISRLKRKNSFLTRAKEKLRKMETENCEEETTQETCFWSNEKMLEKKRKNTGKQKTCLIELN